MTKLILSILFISSLTFCATIQSERIISSSAVNLQLTSIWSIVAKENSLRPSYKYLNKLKYSEITYRSDSLKVKGFIIVPKQEGNYPVIIFNCGGNKTYNELTWKMLVFSTAKLANEGYIILASNYRAQDEYGGKDLNDVLNLVNVADEIENADTSRIGMFGWSRGGMMTYLALKNSNRIKTAVIGNGASDLFLSIKNRPELEQNPISQCIPNYGAHKAQALKKRSAIYWADSLNKESSLLLVCGTLDQKVDYHQSINMGNKLKAIGYDYDLKLYETGHGFRGKKDELNALLIKWFNDRLKE